jgi:hypothetical protein
MKELTEEENLKTEETRELMASLDKTQHELTEYQTNMATIIWACLFFFLVKVNSQGIDSTTTSPNF